MKQPTKKYIARLIFLATLSVSSSLSLAVENLDKAVIGADHTKIVSKRQTVDMILQDAYQIHKSPARVSTAGYTAKMPSNIDRVTEKLLLAYDLEPYRIDLLISAANAQTFNNNIPKAIGLFKKAHNDAPEDKDILTYLVVWSHATKNLEDKALYSKKLEELYPERFSQISSLLELVDNVLSTPLKDSAVENIPEKSAIVTLGYALNPDGTMHEILIGRLEKTLEIANKHPKSLIVLTGGVPQNGNTEGKLMADWLIEKGIDPSRIIEENYATSTVENALYSVYALAKHNIEHATIVSSASHVRRGQVVFDVATQQTGPSKITFDNVSYADKPLSELAEASDNEIFGIYRDALRTMGLWSYRSSPMIER